MVRFKNFMIATLGLAALTAAAVLLTPATATTAPPSPTSNVVVVNTNDNPVPTVAQGTTSITGQVSVTNSPTVALASGAAVRIDTSLGPLPVRSVDDAIRQVFQEQVSLSLPIGSFGDNAVIIVPFGKRAVIEHVSASGIDQAGEHLRYEVLTAHWSQGSQVQSQHFLVSTRQGADLGVYTASQPMRVYGDPDTTIVFSASRARANATAAVTMTVSGYFVDMP